VVENADLVAILVGDAAEGVDLVGRLLEAFPELAEADDPRAQGLAAAPRLRSVVSFGGKETPGLLSHRAFDRLGEAAEAGQEIEAGAEIDVRDPALVLFTSGTTANPKGCVLSHEAVIRVWTSVAATLRIDEDDRVWDALPSFHLSWLGPMTFCIGLGATLITAERFEPAAALAQIEAERATWLYTVFPPIALGLIKHDAFADHDLSRVRGLLNVAPPDTLRLIGEAFAPAIQVGGHFGMTECAGAITCNEWDASLEDRVRTCGAALPGIEVRVVDPQSGEERSRGERGELQIRGYGRLRGYHRDPEHTAALFTDEGWLRSGDLGTMDERGLVTYLGRLKDMLKVGGENVAPSEIESHLSTHPAVKLVQVVGAPDQRLTEVAAAFIELVPGAELSADEAVEYCRGQIAAFKVPRHVRFLSADEWPMSATKIQKFRLQQRIADEIQAGESPIPEEGRR
jgi:acyl-CoA synthetase (AMP-forming)/AMP-acid ligase II